MSDDIIAKRLLVSGTEMNYFMDGDELFFVVEATKIKRKKRILNEMLKFISGNSNVAHEFTVMENMDGKKVLLLRCSYNYNHNAVKHFNRIKLYRKLFNG